MSRPGRCPNSAQPGGEAGGIEWTAADETDACNRLRFKRLEPEPLRHQPVAKGRSSEFESLPPSQPNSFSLRDLRFSWIGDFSPWPK
jgi:hypothetical protein